MGVKYNREYSLIVQDLTDAILAIEDGYEAFEMTAEDWAESSESDRREYMRTLADDLFYGLGRFPSISVGSGKVEYDAPNHVIKVHDGLNLVYMIRLI
jgi:hypothetical protein